MTSYILALDQGTTSSRSLIFDQQGQIISQSQQEFEQFFPEPGWVEHDPLEIWDSQRSTMVDAVQRAGIDWKQIAAIGITNQRETTVVWDRTTGSPIHPAIVWQDRRTADFCDTLKTTDQAAVIQEKTGLIVDAYFSATKVKWILDHVPGAREQASNGTLAFGTIDSWLTWKLTDGKVHVTDPSNASRTMLYNIHTMEWDHELLDLFDVPLSILPDVRPSSQVYGETTPEITIVPIAISGIAGDQQAALFGQQCTESGMIKNTYGTGCFMLMNTGQRAMASKNNLLTTIAWQINGQTTYALEGSVFIGGAVVQWLRDGLKIIRESNDVESLAAKVSDTEGVYVVPAFAGLGAPHWNPHVRGSIFGLTRGSSDAHIARAALDSIAYQTFDVLRAMQADSNLPLRELRVDGGGAINNALMQFQSDVLQCDVVRPMITETTALGAAYLAGLAVGYWKDLADIQSQWKVERRFEVRMTAGDRTKHLDGWQRAVAASKAWSETPKWESRA
ncbi:MAG: glycerol kinase GlpK [Flavobacteriales bacterium]|nr:glycerol kinase GlpK [Flavobacteriales bacterium]